MLIPQEGDILISNDGDLELDTEFEDIFVAEDIDYIKQQIQCRIKTMNPDWFYDRIGSDLEQLLGEPNTKDTGMKGIELIRNSLTANGFIDNDSVYIKPVPVNNDTVTYFVMVKIENTDKPLTFQVNIALSAGINVREV